MKKKYVTTETNLVFKKGIEFEKLNDNTDSMGTWVNVKTGFHRIANVTVDDWIKKGYIKEVEPKEFTKSDMVEFAENCIKQDLKLYADDIHLELKCWTED